MVSCHFDMFAYVSLLIRRFVGSGSGRHSACAALLGSTLELTAVRRMRGPRTDEETVVTEASAGCCGDRWFASAGLRSGCRTPESAPRSGRRRSRSARWALVARDVHIGFGRRFRRVLRRDRQLHPRRLSLLRIPTIVGLARLRIRPRLHATYVPLSHPQFLHFAEGTLHSGLPETTESPAADRFAAALMLRRCAFRGPRRERTVRAPDHR